MSISSRVSVVVWVLASFIVFVEGTVWVTPSACTHKRSLPLSISGKSVVTLSITSSVSVLDEIVWQPLNAASDVITVSTVGYSNALDVNGLTNAYRIDQTTLSVSLVSTNTSTAPSACGIRVVVTVTVPHTVHTVCFKGNCYCNCAARGCGVNIHFAKTSDNIVNTLGYTGFGSSRMDLGWGGIETQTGVYNWGNIDWLSSNLSTQGIIPYYILDYANNLYNGGLSPSTDDSRNAFARFAANATIRYQGQHIIWEMWNEPNIGFWTPTPNVSAYIQLAKATGNAIKAITPGEYYIGPTTAGVDKAFLTSCITSGLLSVWDAVSAHFYRGSNPETAATDFTWLRSLIRQNKPSTKPYIGVLSGEWGYTTVVNVTDARQVTEEQQAQYVSRQYLSNLANDVPISIWYDFHDDGTDPTNSEDRFGLYRNPYYANRVPAYDPKPSGQAAITFFKYLRTLRFNKRIVLSDPNVYVVLFSDSDNPTSLVLASWTTSATPTLVQIPCSSPATFTVVNMYGNQSTVATAANNLLNITVSQSPQYLIPTAKNNFLWLISAIRRLPIEVFGYGNVTVPVSVPNILSSAITVKIGSENAVTLNPGQSAIANEYLWNDISSQGFTSVSIAIQVSGMGSLVLSTYVGYDFSIIPVSSQISKNLLPIIVNNPSGKAFSGSIQISYNGGAATTFSLNFAAGVFSITLNVAVTTPADLTTPYSVVTKIFDSSKALAGTSSATYKLSDDLSKYAVGSFPSTWTIYVAGDATATLTYSLVIGSPSSGAPTSGVSSFSYNYQVSSGWKYLMAMPTSRVPISGTIQSIGIWIYGDAQNDYARLRIYDSTGQTLQYDYAQITWTGWKYVTVTIAGASPGYWGGANDGVVHYPVSWDTYFVWDSTQQQHSGQIYFTAPTVSLS